MQITRRSLFLLVAVAIPSAVFAQHAPNTTQPPLPPEANSTSSDIAGKWHFVFDTEGGPREFDADFKLDGKTVTGKWDKKADVKGTFDAGKLDLEFPSTSEEVGDGILKINGKLADVLTGTWSFQSYDGTFKATRSKS